MSSYLAAVRLRQVVTVVGSHYILNSIHSLTVVSMHIPHEMNLIENFCLWIFPLSQKCINFTGYSMFPCSPPPVECRERQWPMEGPGNTLPWLLPPVHQSPPQNSQRNTGAQSQVGTVPCLGSSQDSPRWPTGPAVMLRGSLTEHLSAPFGLGMWYTWWDPGEGAFWNCKTLIAGWQETKGWARKFQRQENGWRWSLSTRKHRGQKGTATSEQLTDWYSCVDMPFEYIQSHIFTKSHL